MAGIRVSAVTSVGLMTIAAYVGAGGLGYLVFAGIRTINNYQILAGAIPACLLALLVDYVFSIIERLVPNNLLPYIYNDEKELFAPVIQQENLEWIKYENKHKVSIGEVNAFVAAVIQEKLEQFIKNFSYLFIKGSNAPIKINVINIANDKEVVKGIVKFIKKQKIK